MAKQKRKRASIGPITEQDIIDATDSAFRSRSLYVVYNITLGANITKEAWGYLAKHPDLLKDLFYRMPNNKLHHRKKIITLLFSVSDSNGDFVRQAVIRAADSEDLVRHILQTYKNKKEKRK
jgi:hypothetical protein